VSLLIWWVLRPSYGVFAASAALAIEGLGTIVGFAAAQGLMAHLDSPVIALIQAFIAGSVLHVMIDRRDYRHPGH
jgi:hypothetical protein